MVSEHVPWLYENRVLLPGRGNTSSQVSVMLRVAPGDGDRSSSDRTAARRKKG